jgi:hypothetical protein
LLDNSHYTKGGLKPLSLLCVFGSTLRCRDFDGRRKRFFSLVVSVDPFVECGDLIVEGIAGILVAIRLLSHR